MQAQIKKGVKNANHKGGQKMDYEVLSPIGEVEPAVPKGILPRVSDLNGKTIGLFAYFKPWGPTIMREVERQLKEKFPTAKFSHYHFPFHVEEVAKHPQYKDSFKKWVASVDTVVTGHGD
jgi:hypothetical protein